MHEKIKKNSQIHVVLIVDAENAELNLLAITIFC